MSREALRHYEELPVGEPRELGSRSVSESEIVEFARKWDPQPFHVDRAAARESMFGELVASGLHTMAITNRIVADGFYLDVAVLGGPGIENIRFTEPVRPGDTLTVTLEVVSKRVTESDASRGLVRMAQRTTNQDGTQVLSMEVLSLVARRH
jgi:acyl dehydratase